MTMARVRGLRGATTVDADTPGDIEQRTLEMLGEIMRANELTTDDVISILFTATADVISAFPATAARQAGFGSVPLICAQEIPVLLHVTTSTPADELHHIYLHGAKGLRDDLPD